MNEKTMLYVSALLGIPVIVIALESLRTLHNCATFWHRLSYTTMAGGGALMTFSVPELGVVAVGAAATLISLGLMTSLTSLLVIWRHEARYPFR